MRIVAGSHRGRKIIAPEGADIRPTSDRVRESVFNMLEHREWGAGGVSPLSGARVLDAFCGTGACGLEALSRGALHATFMDNSNTALDLCRQNVSALKEQERSDILRNDCLSPTRPAAPCDLAFLDPPYRERLAVKALNALSQAGWIADRGICVLETGVDEIDDPGSRFTILEDRKYGTTRIRIARYEADAVGND